MVWRGQQGWVLCGESNGTQAMAILLYGGGEEGAGDMKDEGTGTVYKNK